MIKEIKQKDKQARARMQKLKKLAHRLKVTFESIQDFDAVACGMCGQGYAVSERESGCTPGQVAYRMKLARQIFDLPKGVGFSRLYQRGQGEVAERIRKQMLPGLRAEYMDMMIKARKHPTPKMAPPQEDTGPTIEEAITILKKQKAA